MYGFGYLTVDQNVNIDGLTVHLLVLYYTMDIVFATPTGDVSYKI
jgi:hypothetical protein